jgi:hypothetical protein
MEISSVSNTAGPISNANANNNASVLVAKKALDAQRQEGAASVKLIDEAGFTGKGKHVNTYA